MQRSISLGVTARAGILPLQAFKYATTLALKGADETEGLTKARAGRASYVPPEALVGVPDPGAKAAAKWLEAVADTLLKDAS